MSLVAALTMAALASGQPPATTYEPLRGFAGGFAEFVERERAAKGLPGVAVAVVDGDRVVMVRGFGTVPLDGNEQPVTNSSPLVADPLGELFAAVALLQRAEKKLLPLDTPLSQQLQTFRPVNAAASRPVTLRHLLGHQAGLPRWAAPDAAETGELLFAPGTRVHLSFAGVILAGRAFEKVTAKPLADELRGVLDPLGLRNTRVGPAERAPAGWAAVPGGAVPVGPGDMGPPFAVATTGDDLARLLQLLVAAKTPQAVTPITPFAFDQMFLPQFAAAGAKEGVGLGGWRIGPLGTLPVAYHVGALGGCSVALGVLPDQRLGVGVVVARSDATGFAGRVVQAGLLGMRQTRTPSDPAPELRPTQPLAPAVARAAAGRYGAGAEQVELVESLGRLWHFHVSGGPLAEVRAGERGAWVVDDATQFAPTLEQVGANVRVGSVTYTRLGATVPGDCPERLRSFLGGYGLSGRPWVGVSERDGKLLLRDEGGNYEPLKELADGVFAFRDVGPHAGERAKFGPDGLTLGGLPLGKAVPAAPARSAGALSITEALEKARRASPPPRRAEPRVSPEWVDVATLDPAPRIALAFVGTENPVGVALLPGGKALLQKPVAEALGRVERDLRKLGFGLIVTDAYRPWSVSQALVLAGYADLVDASNILVGEPKNRGGAVDVRLCDASGAALELPPPGWGFDLGARLADLSGTGVQRYRRDLLRRAMESHQFRPAGMTAFVHAEADQYPVLNVPADKTTP